MSLPRDTHIRLEDGESKVLFAWEGFDGDDCFDVHYITVTTAGVPQRFDFGPCVVWGLRKLDRLLRKLGDPSVGSGFNNPGVRYWDLFRDGDNYRLVIQYTEQRLDFELSLREPQVHNDRSFIQQYDADDT